MQVYSLIHWYAAFQSNFHCLIFDQMLSFLVELSWGHIECAAGTNNLAEVTKGLEELAVSSMADKATGVCQESASTSTLGGNPAEANLSDEARATDVSSPSPAEAELGVLGSSSCSAGMSAGMSDNCRHDSNDLATDPGDDVGSSSSVCGHDGTEERSQGASHDEHAKKSSSGRQLPQQAARQQQAARTVANSPGQASPALKPSSKPKVSKMVLLCCPCFGHWPRFVPLAH